MSAIDSGRIAKIYPHAVKQYLPDYMGLIFEKMCQDYLLYYSDNLPIELSEIGLDELDLIRDYASVFGKGNTKLLRHMEVDYEISNSIGSA